MATLATAPFGSYHFQTLNLFFGLIGNALAVPLVSFVVMPCAVIGVLANKLLLLRILEVIANLLFLNSIEDRRRDLEAERFGSNTEMGFENLADVHTAGHA